MSASVAALPGCQASDQAATVAHQMLEAGAGTSPKTPTHNVIPTKAPVEPQTITVMDERYLGDIARQLGVTVDGVLHDNHLTDSMLKPGQTLLVQTSRDLVAAFETRREERRQRKAAAEQAKKIAKAKAEAEARAAKKAALRAARMTKGKGKAAAKTDIAQGSKSAPKSAVKTAAKTAIGQKH